MKKRETCETQEIILSGPLVRIFQFSVISIIIFNILPIPAGILMAFQNFKPGKGFLKSDFVGISNYIKIPLANEKKRAENISVILTTILCLEDGVQ